MAATSRFSPDLSLPQFRAGTSRLLPKPVPFNFVPFQFFRSERCRVSGAEGIGTRPIFFALRCQLGSRRAASSARRLLSLTA